MLTADQGWQTQKATNDGQSRQNIERNRHQRRAFAIALGLVRDENDARELVQDGFLRVYKGLNNFQGGSSFLTWLYRIITQGTRRTLLGR